MLTFVDSGLLIAAARGNLDMSNRALAILGDATRTFASSEFVRLEVLPKALYHGKISEAEFYRQYFQAVSRWTTDLNGLVTAAADTAERFGLAAMDALHITAAMDSGAEQFVTVEKRSKPLHRVTGLRVITIHPA